ncbi:hypothetical protein GCM10022207_84060 [Streptomyces lannensis]|uniref:Uncharacterized protein n=1 Tax=Streptomyces lannensis TaxID=766498 RepID=A0ABP7LJN8_9ACTN
MGVLARLRTHSSAPTAAQVAAIAYKAVALRGAGLVTASLPRLRRCGVWILAARTGSRSRRGRHVPA